MVLQVRDLESIVPGGVRCLAFAQQHTAPDPETLVEGAREQVREAFRNGAFDQAVHFLEERVLAGRT
ncbi:hypothetical protein [Nocardiopsis deserti]|uniref:hypothetical protein n=1 Tax=Nocardiopsis deserti TaxID=2605988 RepID=UPI001239D526|nr:hypothetical protein [Nocardiopsis deserti]